MMLPRMRDVLFRSSSFAVERGEQDVSGIKMALRRKGWFSDFSCLYSHYRVEMFQDVERPAKMHTGTPIF